MEFLSSLTMFFENVWQSQRWACPIMNCITPWKEKPFPYCWGHRCIFAAVRAYQLKCSFIFFKMYKYFSPKPYIIKRKPFDKRFWTIAFLKWTLLLLHYIEKIQLLFHELNLKIDNNKNKIAFIFRGKT